MLEESIPKLIVLLLDPANNFTETRVFVALVLTAALEFFNAVFKNSMRGRRDTPAMPNSIIAASIHPSASARTLGAFCFPSGSYAVLEGHHKTDLKGEHKHALVEDEL
jgi:hypothetical protein